MTLSLKSALLANQIQRDCLLEAGDDVESGLLAAEYLLSCVEEDEEDEWDETDTFISLAYDIYNRNAQGILNRALEASKKISVAARIDFEKALKKGADSGKAIIAFIDKYRLQLARLLTSTQLASLLEGAREVASTVPTLASFPGAVPPPPSLEPQEAIELVDRLIKKDVEERAAEIYKLPVDQQVYIQQAISSRESRGPEVLGPPTFTPPKPPEGSPEEIHFPVINEAVKLLSERNVMTRNEFDQLDAAARAKSFTVANVQAEETLTKIRDLLAENVREGVDYETFRQAAMDAVDEGTFMSDAHQETVFRTNVQSAFSDGQQSVLENPLVRNGFPYVTYNSIHDDRVRKEHKELDNLGISGTNIYRIDDPVFQLFRPPWSWNCRCGWKPITVRSAAEEGIPEAQEWLNTGIEPSPPAFVSMPDFQPPEGFRRSVSAAPLSIQLSMTSIAAFTVDRMGDHHRGHGTPIGGQFTTPGIGEQDVGGAESGSGGGRGLQQSDTTRSGVEDQTSGPGGTGTGQGGKDPNQSAGDKSTAGPRRTPAADPEVLRKLNNLSAWAERTGKSYIKNWLGDLTDHIQKFGVEASLEHMVPEAQGKHEPVAYDPGEEYHKDWNQWTKDYLNHYGIQSLYNNPSTPKSRVISSITPKAREELAPRPEGTQVAFEPAESGLTDKLKEAKNIPGLESSEDINNIMGRPTTHITDEVVQKLDEHYGKGQWIIKPFTEDAFAGHGIYFPEGIENIQKDTKNTIWSTERQLGKIGYSLLRDETGKISGLQGPYNDTYQFNTPEWETLAQRAAKTSSLTGKMIAELPEHAQNEHGIAFLGRDGKVTDKGFMAQPAFSALQEDMKGRAEGRPYANTEARVHVVTNGGQAKLVPYATFYKKRPFPVVFQDEDSKEIERVAHEAIMAQPEHERQGHVYAPDVIKSATGWKVVELNPSNEVGSSGHLGTNPLIIDSYISAIQGHDPGFVQFIRRILTKREKEGDVSQATSNIEGGLPHSFPVGEQIKPISGHRYHHFNFAHGPSGPFGTNKLTNAVPGGGLHQMTGRRGIHHFEVEVQPSQPHIMGGGVGEGGKGIGEGGPIKHNEVKRVFVNRNASGRDRLSPSQFEAELNKLKKMLPNAVFIDVERDEKGWRVAKPYNQGATMAIDPHGLHHKGKGHPGGGQFTHPGVEEDEQDRTGAKERQSTPANGGGGANSSNRGSQRGSVNDPAAARGTASAQSGDPSQTGGQSRSPSFSLARIQKMLSLVSEVPAWDWSKDRAEQFAKLTPLKAQHKNQVIEAARRSELLVDSSIFSTITSTREFGGGEHFVYQDPLSSTIYKFTKPGISFGLNKDIHQYIGRIKLLSQMWPELGYRFHGIIQDKKTGDPQVVTSMNQISGEPPTIQEIEKYFTQKGWQPHGALYKRKDQFIQLEWRDPTSGVVVRDAHEGNFIKRDGKLLPIDIDILQTSDLGSEEPTEKRMGITKPEEETESSILYGQPLESVGWQGEYQTTKLERRPNKRRFKVVRSKSKNKSKSKKRKKVKL